MKIEITANKLPGLSASLRGALEKIVAETAAQIEAGAKEKAPVDTGNLRASITHDVTGLDGEVSVGADYAVHVHWGTEHQSPQPFLLDAVTEVREGFLSKIAQAVKETTR